jgi:hypothetical protein
MQVFLCIKTPTLADAAGGYTPLRTIASTNPAGEVLRADMGNEVFERQALSPLPLRERPVEG